MPNEKENTVLDVATKCKNHSGLVLIFCEIIREVVLDYLVNIKKKSIFHPMSMHSRFERKPLAAIVCKQMSQIGDDTKMLNIVIIVYSS